MKLVAYCDGACEPFNPGGTATWGYALIAESGATVASGYGIVGSGPKMSNNVAEYSAVLKALEEILEKHLLSKGDVLWMYGDSKLWVCQLSGEWRVLGGLYLPIYRQVKAKVKLLRQRGVSVQFKWIPREQNEIADRLSKQALDEVGVQVKTH